MCCDVVEGEYSVVIAVEQALSEFVRRNGLTALGQVNQIAGVWQDIHLPGLASISSMSLSRASPSARR